MGEKTYEIVARVLGRAPQWVRHDLAAKDANVRGRAEETLAAMITDALTEISSDSSNN